MIVKKLVLAAVTATALTAPLAIATTAAADPYHRYERNEERREEWRERHAYRRPHCVTEWRGFRDGYGHWRKHPVRVCYR